MTILVLLLSAVLGLAGYWALTRLWPDSDVAARLGIGGILALGLGGTLSGLLGMVSVGLAYAGIPLAVVILFVVGRSKPDFAPLRFQFPRGPEALFVLGIVAALLFALFGAIAPSTMLDWDSLAYHLAVPKLWASNGAIASVPFIHQSNFPAAVDSLYLWGGLFKPFVSAKEFMTAYMAFGVLATFGLARKHYGQLAGWWAALTFATVPLVIWESGTAYVDVAHGLFVGLGFYFAARLIQEPDERRWLLLSALSLSFGAGSKYTGLLSIGIAVATVALVTMKRPGGLKAAVLLGVAASLLASPWYVRNIVWKGNPVFPFFYSKLGGQGWDARRAEIYTHEQNTFGLGREAIAEEPDVAKNKLQPMRIGHAILGLATMPGRFVNPGPAQGLGDPLGAMGVAVLAALALWAFSGRAKGEEAALLVASGLTLVSWFFVSQQVRYILDLALPLAFLAGAGVVRLRLGKLLAGIIALQSVYSLYLVDTHAAMDQMRVVLGQTPASEYQMRRIPFYRAATMLNDAKAKKVLLFDEVFGYLLDVPYVWGNPGHSTLIDYDHLNDGNAFADELKRQGFSHVYISLAAIVTPADEAANMSATMGLSDDWRKGMGLPNGVPYDAAKLAALAADFQTKFKVLLIDAVKAGRLKPVAQFPRGGVVFELQ